MPAKFGVGQMDKRVAFDMREAIDDGYGNIVAGPWQEQFRTWAKFIFLHGSETVMAARLESRQTVVAQIWTCAQARQIGTDWQMRDVRRGTLFNVRTINEDRSRAILELLCEQGVATG